MILTCPDCGTQYVVKDGAIPPEGRQVRCAACKHSWHQDPDAESVAAAEAEPVAAADEPRGEVPVEQGAEAEPEDESLAEATMIEPRSGPEAEERAFDEAVVEGEAAEGPSPAIEQSDVSETTPPQEDWKEPPQAEAAPDTFSPFADDDDIEPARRSPLMTVLIIAAVIVVLAALFWFFAPPDLKARLGITAAGASPLALVTTHMDRTKLESGNELLTVTGRVINPTLKEQDVPPLQAQL
jgi:predicted Zn finger-like uncharacterized protein